MKIIEHSKLRAGDVCLFVCLLTDGRTLLKID